MPYLKKFGLPGSLSSNQFMNKFEETGLVLDDHESKTERSVTMTTEENVEKVRELYMEEPSTSTTKA